MTQATLEQQLRDAFATGYNPVQVSVLARGINETNLEVVVGGRIYSLTGNVVSLLKEDAAAAPMLPLEDDFVPHKAVLSKDEGVFIGTDSKITEEVASELKKAAKQALMTGSAATVVGFDGEKITAKTVEPEHLGGAAIGASLSQQFAEAAGEPSGEVELVIDKVSDDGLVAEVSVVEVVDAIAAKPKPVKKSTAK